MPTKDEHIAKAERNAVFAKELTLDSPARIDWALISLFYSAVHYVEAYFATLGTHLTTHKDRDSYISRDSYLRIIFKEYSNLKFFGFNARYEMMKFKAEDFNKCKPDFEKVKAHIRRKI